MASYIVSREATQIHQENVTSLKSMQIYSRNVRLLTLRSDNRCRRNRSELLLKVKRAPLKRIAPTVKPFTVVNRSTLKASNSALPILLPFRPVPLPKSVADIDVEDADQVEFCSEYVKDIYQYLFEQELKYAAKPEYLIHHPSLRPHMRSHLISWLVILHDYCNLLQDTLIMAVSILDRFMSEVRCEVVPGKLQLVGVVCILIAAKYEEVSSVSLADLTYMCDGAYTTWDLRCMECLILDTLQFELGKPLSLQFLRRFSYAAGADTETHLLAKYLIELALFDYSIVHCRPSVIAAAALSVAGVVTDAVHWNDTLHFYCGYRLCELESVSNRLRHLAASARKTRSLQPTFTRFASSNACRVAQMIERNPIVSELCAT